MKKIKKILIGTHNNGKIKEISYLLSKKIKKISPFELNNWLTSNLGLTALSQALDSKGAHTSFGKLPLSTEK